MSEAHRMGQRAHPVHLFAAVVQRLADLKEADLGITSDSIWTWATNNLPRDLSPREGLEVTYTHKPLQSSRGAGVGTSALVWPPELDDRVTAFIREVRPQLHPNDRASAQLRTTAVALLEKNGEVQQCLHGLGTQPADLIAALRR